MFIKANSLSSFKSSLKSEFSELGTRFCLENYHLKVKSHWSALALSGAFSFESESHCAALALIQGICI